MKTYLDWQEIENLTAIIAKQLARDQWKPDYIVGLTRGGLIPATMLSHWFECPMWALTVKLRDNESTESNCWMAEDAFGYSAFDPMTSGDGRKNILIVDDINDTGATLNWIKQDWQTSCHANDDRWLSIWGDNVRVATLISKYSSNTEIPVAYAGKHTTPDDNDNWIVFPWEKWSDY